LRGFMRKAVRGEVFAVEVPQKSLRHVKLFSPSFVSLLLALAVFACSLSVR
jgi:hypothetical protein